MGLIKSGGAIKSGFSLVGPNAGKGGKGQQGGKIGGHGNGGRPPNPFASFNPATLFTGGFTGGFWDFTDAATLFSNTTRTTPATLGGSIQGVNDKSGNNVHLQSSSANNLMGVNYVNFPGGVNRGFVTSSGTTAGSVNGWIACVAIRPTSTSGVQQWMDSDFGSTGRVSQTIYTQGANSGALGSLSFYGTMGAGTFKNTEYGSTTAGNTYVLTIIFLPTSITHRINGVQVGQLTYSSVTPTVASSPNGTYVLGSGYEGTLDYNQRPCNGRMYAALTVNKAPSASEITNLEGWMMYKAGL